MPSPPCPAALPTYIVNAHARARNTELAGQEGIYYRAHAATPAACPFDGWCVFNSHLHDTTSNLEH